MDEKRYYISEASKLIGVEAHVLRYWEEQLELEIKRNEMGHRYYLEEDIHLMQSIRQVMEQGIQLRAVKMLLPGLMNHREETLQELVEEKLVTERTAEKGVEKSAEMGTEKTEVVTIRKQETPERTREVRMAQFQEIMSNLIGQALKENNAELAAATSENVTERVIKEMDYLMRVRESQEEERYKKLDETIRSLQKKRKRLS